MNKKFVGKENANICFKRNEKRYVVYWYDEIGERHDSTFAKWWWEINKGEIPFGYRASYKDNDSLNISSDNVVLLSPLEYAERQSKLFLGREFSDETKEKMSKSAKKKVLTKEHKENIGKATKERWKKGDFDKPEIRAAYSKQGKLTKGNKRTEEQKKKLSDVHKSRLSNIIERKKHSIKMKNHWLDPKNREKHIAGIRKYKEEHPEYNQKMSERLMGRVITEKHREKLSKSLKGHPSLSGKNSHWWKGGRYNNPYPSDFSPYLRQKIKRRDKYACQICGVNVFNSKLGHVHHIDGNKQNNIEDNLILLCASCHLTIHKSNDDRNEKINEFRSRLKQ